MKTITQREKFNSLETNVCHVDTFKYEKLTFKSKNCKHLSNLIGGYLGISFFVSSVCYFATGLEYSIERYPDVAGPLLPVLVVSGTGLFFAARSGLEKSMDFTFSWLDNVFDRIEKARATS